MFSRSGTDGIDYVLTRSQPGESLFRCLLDVFQSRGVYHGCRDILGSLRAELFSGRSYQGINVPQGDPALFAGKIQLR